MRDKRRERHFAQGESLFLRLVKALREGNVVTLMKVVAEAGESGEGVVRELFELRQDGGEHALHIAVRGGSMPCLKLVTETMVEHGISLQGEECLEGRTALHLACSLRKIEAVVYLISRGAKTHVPDWFENQPLDCLVDEDVENERGECRQAGGDLLVLGSNANYQLGTGLNEVNLRVRPISIEDRQDFVMVATAKQHSLFLGESLSVNFEPTSRPFQPAPPTSLLVHCRSFAKRKTSICHLKQPKMGVSGLLELEMVDAWGLAMNGQELKLKWFAASPKMLLS